MAAIRLCSNFFRPNILRFTACFRDRIIPKCTSSYVRMDPALRCFSNTRILLKKEPPDKSDFVTLCFIDRDGDRITVEAKIGENLLNIALDNDIDLEALDCVRYCQDKSELFRKVFDLNSRENEDSIELLLQVTVHFVNRDGAKVAAKASVGDNLLDVIIDNDIDIDGFGACEGTMACSTCHLIFKPADYESIPDKPTDEELDMLDLAYGLTDTSRLGCQVYVRKDMEGWVVTVPTAVADAREP